MTTQRFTQKYALIQLFEKMDDGTEFSADNWPLHATIVDVFAVEWDIPTMIAALFQLLRQHEPVISVATNDTFFGPERQTRVVLLEKTALLAALHYDVVALLESGGLRLNDPQFARSGFLPHATVQAHARVHGGDEVSFTALTLVDMFPNGDPHRRALIKTMPLSTE